MPRRYKQVKSATRNSIVAVIKSKSLKTWKKIVLNKTKFATLGISKTLVQGH